MCVCVCVMTWCIGAVFCETLCVSPRFTTPYITDFRAVILDADCIATAAELLTPVANAGKKKKRLAKRAPIRKKNLHLTGATGIIDLAVLLLLGLLDGVMRLPDL